MSWIEEVLIYEEQDCLEKYGFKRYCVVEKGSE